MATPQLPRPVFQLADEERGLPEPQPMVTSGPIAQRPLTTANVTDQQYDLIDWHAMRRQFVPRMNEKIQQEKDAAQGLARNDFINYDVKLNDQFPPPPSSNVDPSADKSKKDAMTGFFGRNRTLSKISHAEAFATAQVINEDALRKNLDARPRVQLIFKARMATGFREVPDPAGADQVDYYLRQIACNELVDAALDPEILNRPIPEFCETYHRSKKEHQERQEMSSKQRKKRPDQRRRNTTQCEPMSFTDIVYMAADKKGLALERDVRLANRPRTSSGSKVQAWQRSLSTFGTAAEDLPEHKARKDSLSKLSAMNNSIANVGDASRRISAGSGLNMSSGRTSHAFVGAQATDKRTSGASNQRSASSRHASVISSESSHGASDRISAGSQVLREPNSLEPLDWNHALGGPSKRSSREANKRVSEETDNRSNTRSATLNKILPVLDKVLGGSTHREQSVTLSTGSGKQCDKSKFFRALDDETEDDFVKVFGFGAAIKREDPSAPPANDLLDLSEALRPENIPLPLEPHNPEDGNIGISKPLDGSLHKGTFSRQVQQTLNPRAINATDRGYILLDNFEPHDHRIHIPEFLDTDLAHLAKKKLFRRAVDMKTWQQRNKTKPGVYQALQYRYMGPASPEHNQDEAGPEEDSAGQEAHRTQQGQRHGFESLEQHPSFLDVEKPGPEGSGVGRKFAKGLYAGSSASTANSGLAVKGKGKEPLRTGATDTLSELINKGPRTYPGCDDMSDTATMKTFRTSRSNVTYRIKDMLQFHNTQERESEGSDTATIRVPVVDTDESEIHPLLRKEQKAADDSADIMQRGYLLLVREYEQKKKRQNPSFRLNSDADDSFWDHHLSLPRPDQFSKTSDVLKVCTQRDALAYTRFQAGNRGLEAIPRSMSQDTSGSAEFKDVKDVPFRDQLDGDGLHAQAFVTDSETVGKYRSIAGGTDHCEGWNPPPWLSRHKSTPLDLKLSGVIQLQNSATGHNEDADADRCLETQNTIAQARVGHSARDTTNPSSPRSLNTSGEDIFTSDTNNSKSIANRNQLLTTAERHTNKRSVGDRVTSGPGCPMQIASPSRVSKCTRSISTEAPVVGPGIPTVAIISATPENTVKGKRMDGALTLTTGLAVSTSEHIPVGTGYSSAHILDRPAKFDASSRILVLPSTDLETGSEQMALPRDDLPGLRQPALAQGCTPAPGCAVTSTKGAAVTRSASRYVTVIIETPEDALNGGHVTVEGSTSQPGTVRTPIPLSQETGTPVAPAITPLGGTTLEGLVPAPLRIVKRVTGPCSASTVCSKLPVPRRAEYAQRVPRSGSGSRGRFLPEMMKSPTEETSMRFSHALSAPNGQVPSLSYSHRGQTLVAAVRRSTSATGSQAAETPSRRLSLPGHGFDGDNHQVMGAAFESGNNGPGSKITGPGVVGTPFMADHHYGERQLTPNSGNNARSTAGEQANSAAPHGTQDRSELPATSSPPVPTQLPGHYANAVDAAYKKQKQRVAAQRAAIIGPTLRAPMSYDGKLRSYKVDGWRFPAESGCQSTPILRSTMSFDRVGTLRNEHSARSSQEAGGQNGPSVRMMRSPTNEDVLRSAYGDQGMRYVPTFSPASGKRVGPATVRGDDVADGATNSPPWIAPSQYSFEPGSTGEPGYGEYGEHLLQYRGDYFTGPKSRLRSVSSGQSLRSACGPGGLDGEVQHTMAPSGHAEARLLRRVVTAPVTAFGSENTTLRQVPAGATLRPKSTGIEAPIEPSDQPRHPPDKVLVHGDQRRQESRPASIRSEDANEQPSPIPRPIVRTHEALHLAHSFRRHASQAATDPNTQPSHASCQRLDFGATNERAHPSLPPTSCRSRQRREDKGGV